MKKLYYLYIALALFVLGTMAFELLIDRRVTKSYAASVVASQRAMAGRISFGRLQQLATDLDVPGNDVFDDRAIDAEAARLERAFAAFERAMSDERQRIAATEPRAEAASMLKEIADIEVEMRNLVAEGRRIFPALREGRTGEAGARMARMDRAYHTAQKELADLDALLRRQHEQIFTVQARQADALRNRYTVLIAVLNALSLIALGLFGRYMLRQLRAAGERDRVFGDAIEGISFVDLQGRYTLVNPAFAAALGYEPAELIGMPCAATLHPSALKTIIASFAGTPRSAKVERDVQALRKGGETLDVRLAVVASRDSGGTLLGHYCFAKDITEQKRAEAALRKSEERFHLAARATNDLVWEVDFVAKHCWISEAFEHQFGYSFSGDVDIRVWTDAIHPDDAGRISARLQRFLASDEVLWSEEYRFRRGDGGYAEVVDHGYCVRDAEGKPLRMIGAMRDATETKRAERAYNTQLLNAAADGIFALDAEGHVTFVNQSAAQMIGWSVAELLGKDMHAVAHHRHPDGREYPVDECPIQKTRRTGETSRSDQEVFWRKDGSNIAVEYTSTPVRGGSGEITGLVVTFRDISERRFVEQMKDEFVSVVSHELRTPLTSIRGALGLLAAGRLGEIPEKGKRMLDIAVSNTDRLVRLINDILDIERMESGKATLALQPCDAGNLMAQAVDLIRPMAEKAGVTLRWEACDTSLLADPDRLLQTFTNLLGNAVKFSPPGETVSLTASAGADSVLFEVADRGRGIPADKLELVFERFQQVDASDSREKGGSGLGLPICRSIVHQHGGEIWAESGPGAGSRFRFTIPRAAAAAPATTGRTILVCDDDQPIRELLTALLEQKGHRVAAVASGHELFDRLAAGAPDVILLDLLMPDMNGWETLERLKSNPASASIPVVIISVFSADRSGPLFSDLAGWIQKPLDREMVAGAIEDALPTRKKVLLVEDDLDLARVIAEGLAPHGIETVHAADGRAAIELARTQTPDLLILDLVLPDIDGFAVVDWLKDHDVLRSVPVMIYSGTEPTPSQRDRLKLGPTEFLTKGRTTPAELEDRVIRLLDSVIGSRPEQRSHVA
jgi:PAS domain S-box-containing protein